ncbi:MAG: glycosyltransferase family 9 protein, partial [Proteobacteria bacterium]
MIRNQNEFGGGATIFKIIDKFLKLLVVIVGRFRTSHLTRPKSILIIKLAAMGDAICLMPSLRLLKESNPHIEIDWLTTQKSCPSLFDKCGFIRKIYAIPSSKGFVGSALYFVEFLTKIRRYDLLVDFDQYYRVSELVALLGKSSAGFLTPIKGRFYDLNSEYD